MSHPAQGPGEWDSFNTQPQYQANDMSYNTGYQNQPNSSFNQNMGMMMPGQQTQPNLMPHMNTGYQSVFQSDSYGQSQYPQNSGYGQAPEQTQGEYITPSHLTHPPQQTQQNQKANPAVNSAGMYGHHQEAETADDGQRANARKSPPLALASFKDKPPFAEVDTATQRQSALPSKDHNGKDIKTSKISQKRPRRPKPTKGDADTNEAESAEPEDISLEPREWYGDPPKPPRPWGPTVKDNYIFRYTDVGCLEPSRKFTVDEMKTYLFGEPKGVCEKQKPFQEYEVLPGVPNTNKHRKGLTLWIGWPPAQCNHRYKTTPFCMFRDCAESHNTIQQGAPRVVFDERMNERGDQIDPFFNAGQCHLYCLEKYIDIFSLFIKVDVRLDNRQFIREEKNCGSIDRKNPGIRNELELWWKSQFPTWFSYYEQERRRPPYKHENSLTAQLCRHSVEHEGKGRKNTRRNRNGNDVSQHLGDLTKATKTKSHQRAHTATTTPANTMPSTPTGSTAGGAQYGAQQNKRKRTADDDGQAMRQAPGHCGEQMVQVRLAEYERLQAIDRQMKEILARNPQIFTDGNIPSGSTFEAPSSAQQPIILNSSTKRRRDQISEDENCVVAGSMDRSSKKARRLSDNNQASFAGPSAANYPSQNPQLQQQQYKTETMPTQSLLNTGSDVSQFSSGPLPMPGYLNQPLDYSGGVMAYPSSQPSGTDLPQPTAYQQGPNASAPFMTAAGNNYQQTSGVEGSYGRWMEPAAGESGVIDTNVDPSLFGDFDSNNASSSSHDPQQTGVKQQQPPPTMKQDEAELAPFSDLTSLEDFSFDSGFNPSPNNIENTDRPQHHLPPIMGDDQNGNQSQWLFDQSPPRANAAPTYQNQNEAGASWQQRQQQHNQEPYASSSIHTLDAGTTPPGGNPLFSPYIKQEGEFEEDQTTPTPTNMGLPQRQGQHGRRGQEQDDIFDRNLREFNNDVNRES